MNKELRLGRADRSDQVWSPRYAVALSFGPSSTALFHILHETMVGRRNRNSKGVYGLLAVHVDTDPGTVSNNKERVLQQWRERYPDVQFERVSLASGRPDVLRTLLPDASASSPDRPEQEWGLGDFFASLPSATSRADMSRILVQQQLMSWAREKNCTALLLGHSVTALSELAISEVAKGRGYGVPWLIRDGPIPVHQSLHSQDTSAAELQFGEQQLGENKDADDVLPVYRLFREVFRKEASTYVTLVAPTLEGLLDEPTDKNAPIVSLRDVSVDHVVARYFDETEKSYQSVVSNVVRTVDKLQRPRQDTLCAVCDLPVDGQGEARWKGEIGVDESTAAPQLDGINLDDVCYGCKRSLYG